MIDKTITFAVCVLALVLVLIAAKKDFSSMEERHKIEVIELELEKVKMRCDIAGERTDELWQEVFE